MSVSAEWSAGWPTEPGWYWSTFDGIGPVMVEVRADGFVWVRGRARAHPGADPSLARWLRVPEPLPPVGE